MHIFEGVNLTQSLIKAAMTDPNTTLGFESEFYLIGAQSAIQEYLTQGLETVDTEEGNFYTKRLGDTTYHDVLHFWVPLGVEATTTNDNFQILQQRISKAFKYEGGDKEIVSIPEMWNFLTNKYRIHQIMALLAAYPKDLLLGISESDLKVVEDIVYDQDVEEITPFGRLNDLKFMTAEVGFEPDYYNIHVDSATKDAMYNLVAQDLTGKLPGKVYATHDSGIETFTLTSSYSNWVVTSDDSLDKAMLLEGNLGVEVISPKFQATDGMKQLMEFLRILQGDIAGLPVKTTMETGLHINVGVEGKEIDALKMLVLLGDEHILNKFNRVTNEFAEPTLRELQNRLQAASKGHALSTSTPNELVRVTQEILNRVTVDRTDLQRLIELMDRLKPEGKSYSINFAKLPSGYVEFRALGNADYEQRSAEILEAVHRMVVITHIATDPEAYRQDFMKKVYRIVVNAIQSSRSEPIADSRGYGVPLENHPLTKYDGENYDIDSEGGVRYE